MTEFKTEDQKRAFIYLVQDNYSRTMVACRLSAEHKASFTLENLARVKAE